MPPMPTFVETRPAALHDAEPRSPGRRLGSLALSLMLAVACFLLPVWMGLGDFNLESTMMGKDYEAMSLDPLGGTGPHPERFLSPLLAWLLGLSGGRYWLFSHGMLVVFLTIVQHVTFRKSGDRVWATAFTFGLSISAVVATYRGLVGYSDPLTLCLLAGAIVLARRQTTFWVLLGACLLNHGQTLFFWPWLVHQRSRVARLGWGDAALAVAGVAAYLFARACLISDDAAAAAKTFSGANLSLSWYVKQIDWARAADLWLLILPGTVFCFGFQLIVLAWDLVGPHRREAVVSVCLMLVAIGAILVIAIDIFRFVALLAFPMFVAMHRRFVPRRRSVVALWLAIAGSIAIERWQRDVVSFLMDRLVESALAGRTAPLVTGVLPQYWWVFGGYVAFLALVGFAAVRTAPRCEI